MCSPIHVDWPGQTGNWFILDNTRSLVQKKWDEKERDKRWGVGCARAVAAAGLEEDKE